MEISKRFWEMPELTEVNRLPMHSGLIPYATPEQCRSADPVASPYYLDLNGIWDFILLPRPEAEIAGQNWQPITVPGLWTMQGFPDRPIYTNVAMPFANRPPYVPEENPTGVYRTVFTLPEYWRERRVVLHVGGAESVLEVYLNGHFVGMGKDCRLPSEFDLSPWLQPHGNELICKVIRWSDASYVEDQDQWWHGGIHRGCHLYATDRRGTLADLFVRGDLDLASGEGVLRVEASLGFALPIPERANALTGPQEDFLVDFSLDDSGGQRVWEETVRVSAFFHDDHYLACASARLPRIRPWSSEEPNLYALTAVLRRLDGSVLDVRGLRTGFRHVHIANRQLLLNGKRVLIRGVNRHEHDDVTGKVLSRETMLADIRLLKQFNFNAVRNSHYPNDPRWYDLCDEYGIWLLDEANLECHDNYPILCRDPRWRRAWVARCERMVLRSRNHPCIFGWSLGNEAGYGDNHLAAARAIRALDDSRIVHCEGELKAAWNQSANACHSRGPNLANDLVNPMYPAPDVLIALAQSEADDRPVILCEYNHAMGNSNGCLAEYWDAFKTQPGLQGGFIWDWVDQGLKKNAPDGRSYWAYGGDFGETIHDFDFCINGMVWPDRTPHPGMFEFKYLAQPVSVRHAGGFAFSIGNDQDFRTLAWLQGRWQLLVDGVVRTEGTLPELKAGPGHRMPVTLPATLECRPAGAPVHLRFVFAAAAATPWCPAGHVVATEQIDVSREVPELPRPVVAPVRLAVALREQGDGWLVTTPLWSLTLDRRSGAAALLADGAPVLAELPRFNVWRACTDNDGIRYWSGQMSKPMGHWLKAGFHELREELLECNASASADGIRLVRAYRYTGTDPDQPIDFVQTILVQPDGTLEFHHSYDFAAGLPTLPRVGVQAVTAPGFEQVVYWGRGPHENYRDRCRGAFYGRYEDSVSAMYTPYILPQEHGCRTGVTRLQLGNGRLLLEVEAAAGSFEFTASHYGAAELFAARHTCDLQPRPETILCLDLHQRGLGTGSCGPQTLDAYALAPGHYELAFRLRLRAAARA